MTDIRSDMREPPHSTEAETAVIGACLIKPDVVHDVLSIINTDDFYSHANRLIFAAIETITSANKGLDAVTVFEQLESQGDAEACGGLTAITNFVKQTPSAVNVKNYAAIVRERAELRRLIAIGYEISDSAYQRGASATEIMQAATMAMVSVEHNVGDENLLPFKASARAYIGVLQDRAEGKIKYREVGIADLDAKLGVIEVDAQIVVGARPSMGKTAFGANIASIGARRGEVVLVFTLEMNRNQYMDRIVAVTANVDGQKLKKGELSEREWDDVQMATASLLTETGDIIIDDHAYQTLATMTSKARKVKRKWGRLDRIIVDYLQLVQVKGEDTRATELGEISRGMKLLAKELHCNTYLFCQLNRDVESRHNKRPMLSDLRESGAIEQDADIVVMLYRDEVYNFDTINRGIMELGCVKVREGSTGAVPVLFKGETGRISQAAPGDYKREEKKPPTGAGGYRGK